MPAAAGSGPLATLVALLACLAVLGGCIVERKMGAHVENDLGEPVDIVYLADPEVIVGHLGTDDTTTASRDNQNTFDTVDFGMERTPHWCTEADTVARAVDGRVVARIPPPLCDDSFTTLSYERGLVNDRADPVNVSQVVDGREVPMVRLAVGDASGWAFHAVRLEGGPLCTDVDIVLRDDAGAEIARILPPLCTWEPVFLSEVPAGVSTGRP